MEGRIESDPDRIAAMLIGFPEAHVLSVDEDEDGLWVEVETRDDIAQCPTCGTQATSDQTRGVDREGLPVFGRALHLSWKVRGWCSPNATCPTGSWSEEIPGARGPEISED
jgi:hypothetical protein